MHRIEIMALRHSAFYSPLLMCIAGGFLRAQGLEPSYRIATPKNTVEDNIRQGLCHCAQSTIATSFCYLEQNRSVDIVHFAQINSRDGFFITARQADDRFEWHKLIRKKVLVDHFFQPLAMLKYALHLQALDVQQLDVIDAGNAQQIDMAFRADQGDFAHQQGPFPQQLQSDGAGHVVASVGQAIGPVAFSSLCASRAWLHTDMAKSFMVAYTQALRYVIDAPAPEIAAKQQSAGFFTDIDPHVLSNTIQTYQDLGCWEYEVMIPTQYYEKLLDVFAFNKLISKRHCYASMIVPPPL